MAHAVAKPSPSTPAEAARTSGATPPRTASRSTRRSRTPAWLYVLLSAGLVAMLGPFVWMVLGSVKPEAEIRGVPPTWLPETATWGNYSELIDRLNFPLFFFNSVLVAVLVTAGNVVFASMVAYALAKLVFPGRRAVFVLLLATLMVPGMALFIPQFVLVSNLGLVDSYAGLVLPFLVAPLAVFLLRQFIVGIPDELLEAARIDGAGELRIYWQIILPLTRPALATVAIIVFLSSWNNFLWPLVVAQSEAHYTLPIALALYSTGQNQTQYGLLLAGATVVVLPVIALFVALQRYFTQSLATTGFK